MSAKLDAGQRASSKHANLALHGRRLEFSRCWWHVPCGLLGAVAEEEIFHLAGQVLTRSGIREIESQLPRLFTHFAVDSLAQRARVG
jgi:hypothetical protein